MSQRPNILIITNHDSGRHFGCYGVETVHTPAIDALAADGMRFENYFATVPLCSPSRGAMLTGRYPQSTGLMGLTHAPWHWSLNKGEQHLSHILRDAGYHTALFGLQHEAADVQTLDGRLWAWLEEVGDPILKGSVPTPYYRRLMTEAGRG